ncbi:mannosyl-oligosaccharide 1,2-alpha-mannosidase IC isoform X6 [Ictidomys tridecemlineatus]
MLMRKVPGFVPASPWGLRLPQKFLFLLFLSGLVTLCFGALFLLPHSSRLKRLFLAPRAQKPGLELVAEVGGRSPPGKQEPPRNPALAEPALGARHHRVSPRRKEWMRRAQHLKEWIPRARPTEEHIPTTASSSLLRFDFEAFQRRLRHPVLGTRAESTEPQSPVRAQREKIKEMMQFAWASYRRYAMGKNELRPLSKDGYQGHIFGGLNGATIIDSLDTLYLMELKEEFQEAKAWVENYFHLNVTGEASLFEVNIRYIGGLLSAFYLTGEEVFRSKAIQLGEKLLPAFNTPTGIPKSVVNFKRGNWGWASTGGSSILAECGSLHLEFLHLTELSGNQIFAEKVRRIRRVLRDMKKPYGLYPNFLSPVTGTWEQQMQSILTQNALPNPKARRGEEGLSYRDQGELRTWLGLGRPRQEDGKCEASLARQPGPVSKHKNGREHSSGVECFPACVRLCSINKQKEPRTASPCKGRAGLPRQAANPAGRGEAVASLPTLSLRKLEGTPTHTPEGHDFIFCLCQGPRGGAQSLPYGKLLHINKV